MAKEERLLLGSQIELEVPQSWEDHATRSSIKINLNQLEV
jgi:hypothetical protein